MSENINTYKKFKKQKHAANIYKYLQLTSIIKLIILGKISPKSILVILLYYINFY